MKDGSLDDWRGEDACFFLKARNFSFPVFNLKARCSSSITLSLSLGVDVEREDATSGRILTDG